MSKRPAAEEHRDRRSSATPHNSFDGNRNARVRASDLLQSRRPVVPHLQVCRCAVGDALPTRLLALWIVSQSCCTQYFLWFLTEESEDRRKGYGAVESS